MLSLTYSDRRCMTTSRLTVADRASEAADLELAKQALEVAIEADLEVDVAASRAELASNERWRKREPVTPAKPEDVPLFDQGEMRSHR